MPYLDYAIVSHKPLYRTCVAMLIKEFITQMQIGNLWAVVAVINSHNISDAEDADRMCAKD